MKLEAKIGLFVVMGLVALLLLSTQVTNFGGWNQKGYTVFAYINDATGLERNTNVSMNGVQIGKVTDIMIEGRRVKLLFFINDEVEVASDSVVLIAQESVLGAKMVNIVQGSSTTALKDGEEIKQFKQYAALDETSDAVNAAARQLELLMKDLRDVLGADQKQDLREMIKAFRDTGVHLDQIVLENRVALSDAVKNFRDMGAAFTNTANTINADLPEIMERINSLSARLDNLSVALENKLPEAMEKFIAIENNVSSVIEDNRDSLNAALVSADSFFDSGQSAFDKVDSLLSNFTVSELQVGLRGEYRFRDADSKAYGSVIYRPNPETYYLLDVINMGDYTREGIDPQKHEKSKLYVSGQYGKRYGDLMLRAGVIESTGGVGIDYFAYADKFKASAEIYDFNAVNDVRSENPHAKILLRYRFLKHLEVYAGWDNFLNRETQNIFLGAGIKFIDNNLKYFFGTSTAAIK